MGKGVRHWRRLNNLVCACWEKAIMLGIECVGATKIFLLGLTWQATESGQHGFSIRVQDSLPRDCFPVYDTTAAALGVT